MAFQPLHTSVCRFLVQVPKNDGTRNGCGLFLTLATRQAQRDLGEGQKLEAHDCVRVQAQLPVQLSDASLVPLNRDVRDVHRRVDDPRLIGVQRLLSTLPSVVVSGPANCLLLLLDDVARRLGRHNNTPGLRLPLGVLPYLESQLEARDCLARQAVVPEEPQALVARGWQRWTLRIISLENRRDEPEVLFVIEDLQDAPPEGNEGLAVGYAAHQSHSLADGFSCPPGPRCAARALRAPAASKQGRGPEEG
mmetsp:Transcript_15918/g.55344  ORF Transcript_15918/g.55344 Transcript_15918/m.55344 type:complete len:250 (-) Transcript_15918:8-757(-)